VTFRVELLRAGKLVTIAGRKLTIKPKKAHKKPAHGPARRTVRVSWPTF
jgi:RNase P/RNase MRP subunit p29